MIPLGELAAFVAAICWTLTGMITVGLVREMGALRANHLRLWFVSAMLLLAAAIFGEWTVVMAHLGLVFISGIVGIAIGDCLLFSALKRLGPSRNFVTFSAAAPFGALLAFLFYGETLSITALAGCLLVLIAIILAPQASALQTQPATPPPPLMMDDIHGSLLAGLAFGILAALCQAIGAVLIKPALDAGADPLTISALRVIVGAVGLFCFCLWRGRGVLSFSGWTPKLLARAALSGFMGMGVGMTLLVYALSKTEAGIALSLSSTTPLLSLLAVYAITKRRPSLSSCLAGLFAVVGAGLLFV